MEYKGHINEFETIDWITFGGSIVAFAVWLFGTTFVVSASLWEQLWLTGVPMVLVAIMASRRWSALLDWGPAAPLK